MQKFYLKIIPLYLVFSAFGIASAEEVLLKGECLAAPDLIQKLALYGVPIFVLVVAGMVFSKIWATKAVRNGIPPSSHATAGWACGLFLSSLAFAGMLYATSIQNDTAGEFLSQSSCYPDGWEIIAGILIVVTLGVFAFTKTNAK